MKNFIKLNALIPAGSCQPSSIPVCSDRFSQLSGADTIHDFEVGSRFRRAEVISLGAGLSLAQIVLETGQGDYAGDMLIRHGDRFLARLVGMGIEEVAIATHFTSRQLHG